MKHLKKFSKILNQSIAHQKSNSRSSSVIKCLPSSKTDSQQQQLKKSLPELRGLPIIGFLQFLLESRGGRKLHEYVDGKHRQLGPIYRSKVGPVSAVFISSPNLYRSVFSLEGQTPKHFIPEAWLLYNKIRECKRGVLFMDGEEWLYYRRKLSKILLAPELGDWCIEPSARVAREVVDNWRCNSSSVKNLDGHLYAWSSDVILGSLIGSKWPNNQQFFASPLEKEEFAKSLHRIFECSVSLSQLPVKLAKTLRLPIWRRYLASQDFALLTVRNLVAKMMLVEGDGLMKLMMDEDIRDEHLVRIVSDLITAASDTTVSTTKWILYSLSTNPSEQESLYEDIKHLDSRQTLKSPMLKGTLKESLRLHPTAPFITRFLPEDATLSGYDISKGELVCLSLYSSGRDEANFADPDKFMPSRWVRDANGNYSNAINPRASIPFALGVRSCLGKRFAETMIMTLVAQIVKNYKIDCVNKDKIKMILHLISVPSEDLQLRLTPREN